MSSQDAKSVAKEVIETLGKGKKVVLGKIITKHGYSKKTAWNPKNITNTKSYKDVVDPFVKAMETERERMLTAISKKNLSKEKTRDLVDGFDKLTKNIQLLNGGKTSSEGVTISWEK